MNQFIKGCLCAFNGALIIFNDEGELWSTELAKLFSSELKAALLSVSHTEGRFRRLAAGRHR